MADVARGTAQAISCPDGADQPLSGNTSKRVGDTTSYLPAIIVTNTEYRFIVAEQAAEIGTELAGVLLEPVARNTAAAIAAAAVFAADQIRPRCGPAHTALRSCR